MNFRKIGIAKTGVGKHGKKYINVILDPAQVREMVIEDYKKIYLFKSDFRKSITEPDYVVMAPTKGNEEYEQDR